MNKIVQKHKKRIELFSSIDSCNDILTLEKQLYSHCVVASNTTAFKPFGYWGKKCDEISMKIINLCERKLLEDLKYIERYIYLDKVFFLKRCMIQKTLEPEFVYDNKNLLELETLKMYCEMSFSEDKYSEVIEMLLKHIEITNLISKTHIYMNYNVENMTKIQSNQIHDSQIKIFQEQICYLEQKLKLLKINARSEKDKMKKIDLEIEIFELQENIDTKKYLVKQYEKRKA